MKLNVLLVTYNHSKFIKQTLDTVLFQRTDFEFNVIIADDSSTDNTVEIIREYEKKTDIPFVFLDSINNLGITKNYQRAFESCDGEYIAVIEGDDIWTNPGRLQKHVDFLENHLECVMSFNRYIVSDFEKSSFTIQPVWRANEEFQLVTSRDLAKDNFIGNFSTCVYRTSEIRRLPKELFEMKSYDWITNIVLGKNGMIGYLSEIMNMYRIHANGTWSSKSRESNLKDMIQSIDIYNEFTNYIFNNELTEHKDRLKMSLFIDNKTNIMENVKKTGFISKIIRLKDYMPPLLVWVIKAIIPVKILNKLR